MRQFEVFYESSDVKSKDAEMRLDKAFDIIFLELEKAADLRKQNPQNPVCAEGVSVNA